MFHIRLFYIRCMVMSEGSFSLLGGGGYQNVRSFLVFLGKSQQSVVKTTGWGAGVLSVLSFRLNSEGQALQSADGPDEKQCCNSENVSVLSPS